MHSNQKFSVEYSFERLKLHMPKRQDKLEKNLEIKRKQRNKSLESTNSITTQEWDQYSISMLGKILASFWVKVSSL